MDKVIVTSLLVVGAVTAALIVILTLLPVIGQGSQAVIESQGEAAGRIKTSIEVIAVSGSTDGKRIDAWVKNVGKASIIAIERSDVFLIRSTDPGIRFDSLTHSGDQQGDGITKVWTGDLIDDSATTLPWNRADTLHVGVNLSASDAIGTGDHVLRFSTPNGITAQKTFEKLGS